MDYLELIGILIGDGCFGYFRKSFLRFFLWRKVLKFGEMNYWFYEFLSVLCCVYEFINYIVFSYVMLLIGIFKG